jgi:hypothetical protein
LESEIALHLSLTSSAVFSLGFSQNINVFISLISPPVPDFPHTLFVPRNTEGDDKLKLKGIYKLVKSMRILRQKLY